MRTEQLIADLAARVTPVTRVWGPSTRMLLWCAVAAASGAMGLLVFGPRRNLALVISEPWFVANAALVIAVAASAALTSLVLAVPGRERSPAMRVLAFLLLSAWAVSATAAVVRAGHGLSGASDWPICFMRVIGIGAVPAWMLFMMLGRGFPLRRGEASALAALGAMAIGSVTIQFVCPLDVPSHTFLGHFGPAVSLCGLAAWAAPRVLPAPH